MTSELYGRPSIPRRSPKQVDVLSLLSLAIRNNMEYYIGRKLTTAYADELDRNTLSTVKHIVKECDNKFRHIQHALRTLNSCLTDYLLIKTYYVHPRIGNDVDIIVHNFDEAVEALLRAKINLVRYSKRDQRAIFFQETKFHLHGNISWAKEGSTFIDDELIWVKPRTVTLGQVQTKIPNIDADFLIHLAHINFERLHVTLSDLLYLCKVATKVNWNVVLKQASKHHWGRTLTHSIKLLDTIHHTFYLQPCPFMKWDLRHRGFDNLKFVSLPKSLSRRRIFLAFMEKELLMWVVCNRILKSMHILTSGDTTNYSRSDYSTSLLKRINKQSI